MEAIFEIGGWKKKIEVTWRDLDRGVFEVMLVSPMSILAGDLSGIDNLRAVRVMFRYAGKTTEGTHFFRYGG